jgi:hypothetical protein
MSPNYNGERSVNSSRAKLPLDLGQRFGKREPLFAFVRLDLAAREAVRLAFGHPAQRSQKSPRLVGVKQQPEIFVKRRSFQLA